jgi:hypothetical protein
LFTTQWIVAHAVGHEAVETSADALVTRRLSRRSPQPIGLFQAIEPRQITEHPLFLFPFYETLSKVELAFKRDIGEIRDIYTGKTSSNGIISSV